MTRRPLALACAAALALAVPACGSDDEGPAGKPAAKEGDAAAAAALSDAAAKTTDAGSAVLELKGDVDAAGQKVQLAGKGPISYDPLEADLTTRTNVGGQDIEVRSLIDGSKYYLELPAGLPIGEGKRWALLDLEKAGASDGQLGQLLQGSQTQDPSQYLRFLEQAADVTEVGDQTIDGRPTTHYRAVIDLKRASTKSGASAADKAAAEQALRTLGSAKLPTDVFVGEDGMVRRQQVAITTKAQGSTPATKTKLTIDLSDYGVDVDVKAPPKSETFDLTELAAQAGAAGAVPTP